MPDWLGRRKSPRYPIVVPVLYTLEGREPAAAGAGWTRDLGEGGAGLELAERLDPTTPLRVLLRTDRGSITTDARVVWARPEPTTEAILHGVSFTGPVPDGHRPLRELFLRKGMVWRAVVRIPVDLSVTCQLKGQPRTLHRGRTENVSRRGLSLRLPLVILPSTLLEIILHTPHGPLKAEGTIVRVEPLEAQRPGEPIRHGFQFSDICLAASVTLGRVLAEAG